MRKGFSIRIPLILCLLTPGCVSMPPEAPPRDAQLFIQADAMSRALEETGLRMPWICVGLEDDYIPNPDVTKDPPQELLSQVKAQGGLLEPISRCNWVGDIGNLDQNRYLQHRSSVEPAHHLWASPVQLHGNEARVWAGVSYGQNNARGFESLYLRDKGEWVFSGYRQVWGPFDLGPVAR